MPELRIPLGEVITWAIITAWALEHHKPDLVALAEARKIKLIGGPEQAIVRAAEFIAATTEYLESVRSQEGALIAMAMAEKAKSTVN